MCREREERNLFYAIMVIVLLAADQLTKTWAANGLGAPMDVIHGIMSFTFVENRGAAFGIMQDMQPVFIVLSLVYAIAASIYITVRRDRLPVLAQLGGWLTIAGAIGNMIDRAIRGYVVDFIYIYAIDFPVFNIADVCLTLGAALLIIYLLFFAPRGQGEAKE